MSSHLLDFLKEIKDLHPQVGSISSEQCKFIQNILRTNTSIKKVLETGFNVGISAAACLDVRENIEVVSFDIFWFDYTRKAKLILDKHYPARHLLIAGNSVGSLKLYFDKMKDDIDFVFIDGGHEWPVPYYDLQQILSHVKEGTIILIDDYCEQHGRHGVIDAVNTIREKGLLINTYVLSDGNGGMLIGMRSAIPFTPEIPDYEIQRALQDVDSHYEKPPSA